MSANDAPWSAPQRLAFRTSFCYFAAYAIGLPLYVIAVTRAPFEELQGALIRMWHGVAPATLTSSAVAADAVLAVVEIGALMLVSFVAAALWIRIDPRRDDRALHAWLRLVLRYAVAIVMLLYGGANVIDSQFPPITLSQLTQPLGRLTPMGLLWVFMGRSVPYATFAGLGESIGALLLFWRRTTTLGAAVLVAVLSNVVLMNFAYDVPVKVLSSTLLLAALVLLAPDVTRLANVLVWNRPVDAADLGPPVRRPWALRLRAIKPVIIGLAVITPMVFSWVLLHLSGRARPPLYGIYEVENIVRNHDTLPPLLPDTSRWKRMVIDVGGILSISLMNDSTSRFVARVDTVRHQLTYWAGRDSARRQLFEYGEQIPGVMQLRGARGADSLLVTLRRMDPDAAYRLMRGQ